MKLQPTIIFTTSYDQYAIKAIRHAAFDFLVKPVDRQELDNAIQRFRKNRDKKTGDQIKSLLEQWHSNKKFKFNTHNGIIFIDPDEIVYLEAQCNYTSIIINNNNEELISTNIGTLEKQLPSPPFFRVSRSAIINTRYLNKINRKEKTCILAKNNMSFNISITKKKIKELEEEL
jgi:two-component system LytT family response regulator